MSTLSACPIAYTAASSSLGASSSESWYKKPAPPFSPTPPVPYQPDKSWLIPKTSDALILGGLGLMSGMLLSEMNAHGLKKTASTALKEIEHSLTHATAVDATDIHKKGNVLYRQEGWVKHPLFMTFLMPFVHPELAPAALAYAVALGGVFVGSNVFQGMQEAWVRWEESCIRANLVNTLQPAFKQSIQTKLQSDTQLRNETSTTLDALFPSPTLPQSLPTATKPTRLSSSPPLPEQQDSEFVYMPFNRDKRSLHAHVLNPQLANLPNASPRSEEGLPSVAPPSVCPAPRPVSPPTKQASPPQEFMPILGQNWGRLGMLGFTGLGGLGLGILLNTTRHLLQNQGLQTMAKRLHPSLRVNLLPNDQEAVALFFKDSWPVLISLAALGATLKVAELLIEGLREIQVTTMNAKTEAQYERYKWQVLDPQFHAIAERTYVEESIRTLKADASHLTPSELNERKQRMLEGIGYHSSPAYYPITPMVQLVPARA
ncbi:MAG: hypothetical protein ACKO34_05285 [Vampirovibrionales bacterium]